MKNIKKTALMLTALTITMVLGSCSHEEQIGQEPVGTKERMVTLSLNTPGVFSELQTRALTQTQENTIREATVIVFAKNGNYKYHKTTTAITDGGSYNKKNIAVSLVTDGAAYDIAVIANLPAGVDIATALAGKKINELHTALPEQAIGKWAGTEFVMTGQLLNQTLTSTTTTITGLSLLRSLASVDVGLGWNSGSKAWDGIANFELTEVYIYKANDKFSIAPNYANLSIPTIPSGTASQALALSYTSVVAGTAGVNVGIGQRIASEVYIASVNNLLGTLTHTTRPAVVVGGKFNGGTTTYYRLDFVKADKTTFLDIIRNNKYRFSITKVEGNGLSTPDEAYKSSTKNMEAEVIPWNETTLDNIVFNGQYYIQYSAREVHFLKTGVASTANIITVKTNVPTFTLGNFTDVTKGTGDGAWVESPTGTWKNDHLTTIISAPTTVGDEKTYTITITAAVAAAGDPARETTFTATGANVVAKLKITQELAPILPYPAYPGVIGYDPVKGDLNLEGRGVMVYFKYGGIIAMQAGSTDNLWLEDGSDVIFNPTNIQITTHKSFPTRPFPDPGSESTVGSVDINTAFHSIVSNAQNGNGDPCRFIKPDGSGMTAAEVKAILTSGVVPDQNYWRLPTNAENTMLAYSPAQSDWVQKAATKAGDATLRNGHTLSGLNNDNLSNFLPAAGYRLGSIGKVASQGTWGLYWSSTNNNNNVGYNLLFKDSTPPTNPALYDQQTGMPIRCVRNIHEQGPVKRGGYADIIYYTGTGDDAKLLVGNWGDGNVIQDNIAFFKFGSVIGATTSKGPWKTTDPVIFNIPNGTYTNPTFAPNYELSDYPKEVSANTYHTLANVKAGKGDPCRLVGMSVAQIRAMSTNEQLYEAEEALAENGIGGWRLPTNNEQAIFAGLEGATTDTYYDVPWSAIHDATSRNGAWLPVGGGNTATQITDRTLNKPNGSFLPAVGSINHGNFGVENVNSRGMYWSSTSTSDGNGFYLFHNFTAIPLRLIPSNANGGYTRIHSIRCVNILD